MTYEKYTLLQRLLHWIIALLVLGALAGGLILEQLGEQQLTVFKPYSDQIYYLHKSAGMAVLMLIVLRIVLRLVNGAPELPASVADWERRAAGLTHFAFYILLVAMPLLGWLATSAYEAPVPMFGLYDFPMLLDKDRDLAARLFWLHGLAGKLLLVLAAMHIGAAVMHGLKRDGVFGRMWF